MDSNIIIDRFEKRVKESNILMINVKRCRKSIDKLLLLIYYIDDKNVSVNMRHSRYSTYVYI